MAGATAWQGGDVGLTLSYLDKAMLTHPLHPQAYHNLGNALATLGQTGAALEAYEIVLKREPENLDALNSKGLALKSLGQIENAETVLCDAVRIAPNSEQSWTNLGLVLRLADKIDEAFGTYEHALRINPALTKALNNLAVLHRWQGNLAEAEGLCRGVLSHHPDMVEVLNNLGDILQAQGRVDEARTAFERVLEIDPTHPEGHHNLAVLMLLCGDFENGWNHYEWRWLAKEFPSERRNFTQPLWLGEALDGKTVLLYVEQGLGDALQFVRYAPLVAAHGGRVVVECPKSLKQLFETVAGVERVVKIYQNSMCSARFCRCRDCCRQWLRKSPRMCLIFRCRVMGSSRGADVCKRLKV